jgi:molybdenum cofactor cytidylyltransferase
MRIGALVLAAGRSWRFAGGNKLLAPLSGVALVARAVTSALASRASPVVVVTGYDAAEVSAALGDLPVVFAHNGVAEQGLASSLQAGLWRLGNTVDGAVVCLADMPYVRPVHIDRLCEAFERSRGRAVCAPTFQGQRGNPVLWPASLFGALLQLRGDTGGRDLLDTATLVERVPVDDAGVLIDVDTLPDLVRCDSIANAITDPR